MGTAIKGQALGPAAERMIAGSGIALGGIGAFFALAGAGVLADSPKFSTLLLGVGILALGICIHFAKRLPLRPIPVLAIGMALWAAFSVFQFYSMKTPQQDFVYANLGSLAMAIFHISLTAERIWSAKRALPAKGDGL